MRIHLKDEDQDLMWLDVDGDTVTGTSEPDLMDRVWVGAKVKDVAAGGILSFKMKHLPDWRVMPHAVERIAEPSPADAVQRDRIKRRRHLDHEIKRHQLPDKDDADMSPIERHYRREVEERRAALIAERNVA
jgi:hypothetical protein